MESELTEGLSWPIHILLLQKVSFPCLHPLSSLPVRPLILSQASALPQFPILANAYLQPARSLRAIVCASATTCYSQYDLPQLSLSPPKLLQIYMRKTFLDGKQPAGGWAACVELSCEESLPGFWRAGIFRPDGTLK